MSPLRSWGLHEVDLAMVLTELVTDAVDHAHTSLTITVSLHPANTDARHGAGGPMVRIEVADHSTAPPRLWPRTGGPPAAKDCR